VDVGQLLLHFKQAQPLAHVVAVVAETAAAPSHLLVVGGDHAAFPARGEGLVLAETARSDVSDGAGLPALVRAAKGLRVVLDDMQTVRFGQFQQRVHVGHVAVKVHGHDRLGPLLDQFFHALHAQAVVITVDVGKTRHRTRLHDGKRACDEGVARHDDLVARAYPEPGQGRVQRAGAVCGADGEARPLPFGEALFKLHAPRARPVVHLPAAQGVIHRRYRRLVKARPGRQRPVERLLSPVNCQCLAHAQFLSS